MAVLFDWNLSRRPLLRQRVNLDLLFTRLNLEYVALFGCLVFTQRPLNEKGSKIAPMMSAAFWSVWKHVLFGLFGNMFSCVKHVLAELNKFHFHMRTICCYCPKFTKALWRSIGPVSQKRQHICLERACHSVVAICYCRRLRNTLCLCLPVLPTKAVSERCTISLAINFEVKAFYCFLEQPLEVMARWPAGAQKWIQTWILQPDQQVANIYLQNLCKWVQNAEIKTSNHFSDPPQLLNSRLFEAEKASERSRWFIAEY